MKQVPKPQSVYWSFARSPGVLMVLNFIAAFLSTAKKERKAVDQEAAAAAKEYEGI